MPRSRLPHPLRRSAVAALGALLVAGMMASAVPSAAAPSAPSRSSYAVQTGTVGEYAYPTDTPAAAFTDKDGRFYFQQSAALYGADDPRYWEFYTGTTFDDATRSAALSDAVDPANAQDRNNDTTWRCNTSPTGRSASYAPGTGYAQKNYCDLLGVWVDPDTGNWYGLVHNEFTPKPFDYGGFSHYDAIDYAVSRDQGHTWTIKGHAITSPYSTKRGDTAAFPHDTWAYGDGDPRLFVDARSGYFYVYYGSRIEAKTAAGGSVVDLAHVARAPMLAKMTQGSWSKFYNGHWSQPGVGGKESNLEPTSARRSGFTPPSADYDPSRTGTTDQQIAAGTLPATSPLFVMNITYSAYLGMYLGTPESVERSTPVSQPIFATRDLAHPRWSQIGDTGSYRTDSWYRWILDGANHTDPSTVGKTFRLYCSISCSKGDGESVDVTITPNTKNPRVALPVPSGHRYKITNADGRLLAEVGHGRTTSTRSSRSAHSVWRFDSNGDGSYRIVNTHSGRALGVDSSHTSQRAWGTAPRTSALSSTGPTLGQQWFVITDGGRLKLINRYSGLALALAGDHDRRSETTPVRSWTDRTHSTVGDGRRAAEQALRLIRS